MTVTITSRSECFLVVLTPSLVIVEISSGDTGIDITVLEESYTFLVYIYVIVVLCRNRYTLWKKILSYLCRLISECYNWVVSESFGNYFLYRVQESCDRKPKEFISGVQRIQGIFYVW